MPHLSPRGQWLPHPPYRVFLREGQLNDPAPVNLWVFLDEHPDTINDGGFAVAMTSQTWVDMPANYHNGACGFSFADGHSEIKKWKSASSNYRNVIYAYPATKAFDAAGKDDLAWYNERTGWVDVVTGKPQFGY